MDKILEFVKANRFNVTAWGVTALIVAALLGSAFWWTQVVVASPATHPLPTTKPNQKPQSPSLPPASSNPSTDTSIERHLQLKTNIPERPRYSVVAYRVSLGDALFSIAKKFNIKPESLLYSNKDVLQDNPENLKPGLELTIPPVDGVYYKWQENDTVESVASQFDAKPDDILGFPGNNLDLTNPRIMPGTMVMIPGGQRELVDWSQFIPTIARNPQGGTGTSEIGGNSCSGGAVGSGFVWPIQSRVVSGNNYGAGHLALDLTGYEGEPISAASSGVVTMAQGGWNYGYGNVIQIDHGNGYVTLYAHLSQINVSPCQSVYAGQLIGLVGNTGNSFGAHLHFEVREGGKNLNPYFVIP
ncbi:MAG: peptidoglycan DD-metalloendopeptidase family protein [Chloroflexi bacterium]|nr:peptidoglycan DD-metalloendopeptidase family protein [Chloroflexota bacterium]MBI3340917.1 peptidoglycan DD-metalloendopeptidase family protein [Chloroflexota bacterium]